MKANDARRGIVKDLSLVVLSIVVAIILAKTGVLEEILLASSQSAIVSSFLAGIFFISVFTVAPSVVVLAEILQVNSLLLVALFGGLGALVGDLVIFRFFKDSLMENVMPLVNHQQRKRLRLVFQHRLFRRLVPFIGALIIASPLPDELGLALMGLSKVKTKIFIPISFVLNFFGILALGLVVKSF